MNEFSAKKLGEVLAFAKVGNETIQKARNAFKEFMSDEDIDGAIERSSKYIETLKSYTDSKNITPVVLAKSEKTAEKIISMRDAYIGSEWETSSEVFEWWGFFAGGAIVHWNLVKGVAETLEDDLLVELAYDAIAYHENLYETAASMLAEIGRKKAI